MAERGRALVITSRDALAADAVEVCRRTAAAAGLAPGPYRELGPGGGEFACGAAAPAGAMEAIRPAAAEVGADANLVPVEGREKRVLVCDMDATIITVESLDELADRAGIGARVAAITDRAMRGEMPFEEALEARLELCRGLPEIELEAVWRERVRLTSGARMLVRTMAARGAETVLVSGGYSWFAERVARAAGFARVHANTLEILDGRLTGRVVPPVLGREAKRRALVAACRKKGVSPVEALAVGDGANDAAMVQAAGLGVAWRPKPVLRAVADAVLERSGLEAVLYLQGLPSSAHVSGATSHQTHMAFPTGG